MTNTEITPESIVQRAQRLLYPAQSTDDMILEHALADPDSVIVKNLKAMPQDHLNWLDRVCRNYETALSTTEERVKKGELEGCFHDGHYYQDPSYAGKSLEETLEGLQLKYVPTEYGARMKSRKKIGKVLEYTAKVVNPLGVYFGVPENPHPSLAFLHLIFYSIGTLATTAAVTALTSWPVGVTYLVAAVGTTQVWQDYEWRTALVWARKSQDRGRPSKLEESYNQLEFISTQQNTLRKEMHNLLLPR